MTTGQTIGTMNGATLRPEQNDLTDKAIKLGRRVQSALPKSNGRITIEIIEAHDGSWLLFVDNGKREVLR